MQNLIFISVFIQLIGYYAYYRDMLRGKTKPNRMTWLLWSFAPLIATSASLSSGEGWSVLPTFLSGFMPLTVFTLSFFIKGAYWKLSKFDYFCGFFSVLALILWAVTKDAVVAVVFSILADGCACLPTIVKTWKEPGTETPLSYFTFMIAASTTFTAIKTPSFTSLGFPVYLVIANCMLILLALRPKLNRKPKP